METGATRPRSLDYRRQDTMSECIPLMDAREMNATERTRRSSHCTTSCSRQQQPRRCSSSETDPDDEALDWPSDGATHRSRRRSLCRQRRLPASQSGEHPLLQPEPTRCKDRKAPPASPSLLTRVKEHIRNHVLLPQPAVMADLRQRAVEAFEASLSSEREPTDSRPWGTKSCRASMDYQDGVARRAAYRRRSISDDTHNRPLPAGLTAAAALRTNSLNDDGVVCSTVDLLSIFKGSRTDVVVGSTGTSGNFTGTSSVATDLSGASSANCESFADGLSSVGHNTTSRDIKWASAATCMSDQQSDAQNAMPEVEYDEYGQTWDVYGADYDPEVLGAAIEKHLERIVSAYQCQHDDICEIALESPHVSSTKESRRHDAGLLQRMLGCLLPAR